MSSDFLTRLDLENITFDPAAIPSTIDGVHLGLGVLALLFLLVAIFRKGGGTKAATANSTDAETTDHDTAVAEPEAKPEPAPAPPALKTSDPDAAFQVLSLLQQEARFIDFLNEDLSGFSDAEIGAVARVVHEGGKKTLNQYFKVDPIRVEQEESRITLDTGFNSEQNRVTGNVVGEPPFTGTLVHRGWQVTEANLPKLADGHDARILAPAEVEL